MSEDVGGQRDVKGFGFSRAASSCKATGRKASNTMSAYYHLKSSGSQYMFNLKGGNGETVLTSERYVSRQGALNGIESVKTNAPYDARYNRLTNSAGSPYFVLKAANGEPIGTSEAYSSTAARDQGIEWVKSNAPGASTRE